MSEVMMHVHIRLLPSSCSSSVHAKGLLGGEPTTL